MHIQRQTSQTLRNQRRGSITLLALAAIVVVLLCAALVLDRSWVDVAHAELTTCAEASALAAARCLADDESLRESADWNSVVNKAFDAAQAAADGNPVASQAIVLDTGLDGDIRIGRHVTNDQGQTLLLQSDWAPNCVEVTARRTRANGNPFPLLLSGLGGVPTTDIEAIGKAGVDNRIVALKPIHGGPVPAVPLAILYDDPAGQRSDTWKKQIEDREGKDEYGFDAATGQTTHGPDGIREIRLTARYRSGAVCLSNVCLLDLGTGFDPHSIQRQLQTGVTSDNLTAIGGRIHAGPESPIIASRVIGDRLPDQFAELGGKPRICLLYRSAADSTANDIQTIHCAGFACGRILKTEVRGDTCEFLFQPAVIVTRTAVVGDNDDVAPNPWIYKLSLTR